MSFFKRIKNLIELSKLEAKVIPEQKRVDVWPVQGKTKMTKAELLGKVNPKFAKVIDLSEPLDVFENRD